MGGPTAAMVWTEGTEVMSGLWRALGAVFRTLALMVGALMVGAASSAAAESAKPLTEEQEKAVGSLVRQYLLDNPEVVAEAIQALQAKRKSTEQKAVRTALRVNRSQIENNPDTPVGGNAKGNVTVVEFFDYRCGVCKRVHPIVAALMKGDGKIRRVYKEWPILGPESVFAARAALASRRQGKYLAFHNALMAAPKVDRNSVLAIAESIGLDRGRLVRDMKDPKIAASLQRNYRLAEALKLNGTPSFVIGDELLRGGRDLASMRRLVALARKRE